MLTFRDLHTTELDSFFLLPRYCWLLLSLIPRYCFCVKAHKTLVILYGEKFSWDKIFAVFADLPQTAKILTAKFCDRHALSFVIVEPRKYFREIFASGQSAKILSHENFSPYSSC